MATIEALAGVPLGESGACPICVREDGDGGNDRFDHKMLRAGPRWFCRGCDRAGRRRWGDARDLEVALGLRAAPTKPDGGMLDRRIRRVVDRATRALWAESNRDMLDVLFMAGLDESDVQRGRLGWHEGGPLLPHWRSEHAAAFTVPTWGEDGRYTSLALWASDTGEARAVMGGRMGRDALLMRAAAGFALSGDDGLRERAEGLARAVGWLGDE